MAPRLPHPIPYQGSKRALAPLIGPHIPRGVDVWFDPFAGSAAMTLWAAHHGIARRYVIADALAPIAHLWQAIIGEPAATAERYRRVWLGQGDGDADYFNRVRSRYNAAADPVDLLYLVCRCVKNAVRFNARGHFTQSVDRRRLGMQPDRMAGAIAGAALLLRGRAEVRSGDWLATTADAGANDFIYLDPPYLGTTVGRDKRYARQLGRDQLIAGLENLLERRVRFALSYDGMTGGRPYGPPLPAALGLSRMLLDAGTSSQATLSGRSERTFESLYLSPGLVVCGASVDLRASHTT
jgi:DNA adenine methylase